MANIGTHCIVELYGCPREPLNDEEFVKNAVREASSHGLATLMGEVSHHFHPHGVTALGLLAESHISVHTWPEHGYAAADVFTCGETANPQKACTYLIKAFQASRYSLTKLVRGPEACLDRDADAPRLEVEPIVAATGWPVA
ncbi:MAG: adenosylmethionine decarboxylase [Phycisphaerae bacterium]